MEIVATFSGTTTEGAHSSTIAPWAFGPHRPLEFSKPATAPTLVLAIPTCPRYCAGDRFPGGRQVDLRSHRVHLDCPLLFHLVETEEGPISSLKGARTPARSIRSMVAPRQ